MVRTHNLFGGFVSIQLARRRIMSFVILVSTKTIITLKFALCYKIVVIMSFNNCNTTILNGYL